MQRFNEVNTLENNHVQLPKTVTSYLHISSTHQDRDEVYITASR